MALLQDSDARTHYENLSDMQKTKIIHYIQSNNQLGNDAKEKINNAIENLRHNNLGFFNSQ